MGFLKRGAVVCGLLSAALIFAVSTAKAADAPQSVNIVVLTSYDESIPWQRAYLSGIRKAADSASEVVTLYIENMDRKRAGARADDTVFRDFLKAKYAGFPIAAVISHDPDANAFVQTYGKEVFGDAPRLMVGDTKEMPGADVVLFQDENMRRSLDAALSLHPNTKRVLVVADDTADGLDRMSKAKEGFRDLEGRYAFDYLHTFSIDELYQRVAAAEKDTVIFYLLVFRDKDGQTFVPRAVVEQMAKVTPAPIYSLWDSLMGSGINGGYLVSAEVMGRRSLEIGLEISHGAPASSIVITEADSNAYIFDWRALKKTGAALDALPPESDVRYRTETFLERYFVETILGGIFLILETILIVWLIVLYRQRGAALRQIALNETNLESKLRERTAALQRSNEDLQHFAYSLSHDLRTPLRTVSGFIGLLERKLGGKLQEEEKEFLNFAIHGAKSMDTMVLDLLAYSRVHSHGEDFSLTEMDEVLDQALFNLSAAIKASGAEVTRTPLPQVTVDKSQIMRVFQNLIGNSLNYARPGIPPRIAVACETRGGDLVFSVTDNGIGIPEENLEDVFNLFRRLNMREGVEGSGMGLALSRRVVERHGGRIWAENVPEGGARFCFTLPREGTREAK